MSLYGRIDVVERTLGSAVRLNVGSTGATVLTASKGSDKPIFIGTGQKNRIIQLFGKPSPVNHGLVEAIHFNQSRPIWISAPSKNGKYGGVFVTKTGTIPFINGLATKDIADFSNVSSTELVGTGDDATTVYSFTLAGKDYYKNMSIDLLVNGTTINVSSTDADPEVLTTTPDVGSGTYNRVTGELAFTFTSAVAEGESIEVSYDMDLADDCYFCITDANPQVSDKYVKFSMNADKSFNMTAEVLNRNTYDSLPNSPFKFSLDPEYRDASNRALYIDNVLRDNDYFDYILNPNATVTTFTDDTSRILMAGGDRGDAIGLPELTIGWDYFKNKNTYRADIFFDTTADAGIVPIFESLRNNNQKYSTYLLPLPLETNKADAISTKAGYSVSNRGISFYWNWGEVNDADSGLIFWTSLMGRVATKHAQMDNYFNGLAPAWIDVNNHGGLLGGGIRRLRWDLQDDSEAIDLENGRVNPIVDDPVYGVTIIAHRTSVLDETDFSYIAHSRLADFILDNIVKQVLPFQITKLNDDRHRNLVSSKTNSIISILAGEPYNLLIDYRIICDESNNSGDVLLRKEFLLEVYVQFTSTSEKIRLVFSATPAGVNIDESIG